MASKRAEKVQVFRAQEEKQIEQQFLYGFKDEDLGVYCNLFSAKTAVEGQDGGVVTSLLLKGFHEGLFDSAIVVRRIDGYNAQAIVAQNAEDVIASKGTKYLKVNVTKKLRELISQGKKRIAIVCTPCEAKAARKIQQTIGKDTEVTVIGLFCFEAFNPAKLRQKVKTRLGIDLDSVEKTQVRQGKFIATVEDREVSCRVKDLHGASEAACRFCDDFTSRLADVSVGSVGSKPGYSTVIVRSSIGEQLLGNHEFAVETADKQEIAKLARFKRERSKKSFADLNQQ
jgi:coenzyme F420-reducing hydrogenase beta subunit